MSKRLGQFVAVIGFAVFFLSSVIILISIIRPPTASYADTPGPPQPANLTGIIWGSAGIFIGSVLIIVGLREVYSKGLTKSKLGVENN
jgi:hypothetical protein